MVVPQGTFAAGELLCVYRGKAVPLAQVLRGNWDEEQTLWNAGWGMGAAHSFKFGVCQPAERFSKGRIWPLWICLDFVALLAELCRRPSGHMYCSMRTALN